jgi:hypothetical protein
LIAANIHMDCQNLGGGGGQDENNSGQGANAGMAGGSRSFMHESAGQSIGQTGTPYQQPFPVMGMPPGTQQMYSRGDYVGGGGVQQVSNIYTTKMVYRLYSLPFRKN